MRYKQRWQEEMREKVHPKRTRRPGRAAMQVNMPCLNALCAASVALCIGDATWTQNGEKRHVWRCVSRLDYGKKYCHQSSTMGENELQMAIMAAINSAMSPKETLVTQITDAMQEELGALPDSTVTIGEVKRRIKELEDEFSLLINDEDAATEYTERFSEIATEMKTLKEQREELAEQLRHNVQLFNRIQDAAIALDGANHHMTRWNEETIRQLVHTVEVAFYLVFAPKCRNDEIWQEGPAKRLATPAPFLISIKL